MQHVERRGGAREGSLRADRTIRADARFSGDVPLYQTAPLPMANAAFFGAWSRVSQLACAITGASGCVVVEFADRFPVLTASCGVFDQDHVPPKLPDSAGLWFFEKAGKLQCGEDWTRAEEAPEVFQRMGHRAIRCIPVSGQPGSVQALIVLLEDGAEEWSPEELLRVQELAGLGEEVIRAETSRAGRLRRERFLVLLNEVAETILNPACEGALPRVIFEIIAPDFALDAYFFYLVRDDTLQLTSGAGIASDFQAVLDFLRIGQGPCGTAADRRQELVIENIQESDWEVVQVLKEMGLRAYVCNPLFAGEDLIGTLAFATAQRDRFEPDEVEFFRLLCRQVALGLDRELRTVALRESETRFRQIADTISHVFWIADFYPAKQVLYVSPAFERIWQRPAGAVYENPGLWLESIHPDDRERVDSCHRAFEDSPAQMDFQLEYRIVRPDGSIRFICDQMRAVRDSEGRLSRLTGVAEDVTARKRAEADLHEAKAAAESANRAKDEFLATLSHELRTPLNPVLLVASALEASPDVPEAIRHDLAAIRRNVEVEARLVDDLLDLTRISRGKLRLETRPVDPERLMQYTIEMLKGDFSGKALGCRTFFRNESVLVQADPVRLQQVFWNILRNAVKFSEAGGAIIVQSHPVRDEMYRMSVSDCGIGIGQEQLEDIFEAFGQGKFGRHFGGLGLGLAISRRLMNIQGGKIYATSEGEGKGATFFIEIPVASEPDLAA